MIKTIGKFIGLNMHSFDQLQNIIQFQYENCSEDKELSRIALVHQDGYFILGIVIQCQYFYPLKQERFYTPNKDQIRSNLPMMIINGQLIQDIKKQYMGFLSVSEWFEYAREKEFFNF